MPTLRRAALGLALVALAACRRPGADLERPIRLGYFPNLTHAQGLVGDDEGTFAKALAPDRLDLRRFNAGPAAMEAMLAGELDATYVGPGPAINAYVRSDGALRVIAGATSGGAVLVVRSAAGPEDLRGKKVASPQLGNTQDIALRRWLKTQGLEPTAGAFGDVTVIPVQNPEILSLFRRGELEGAWVPEPWGALLEREGGRILVDERDLWPGGRFATTVLVASRRALEHRRPQLERLLRAHLELTRRAQTDPKAFAEATNAAFAKATGRPLDPAVLAAAMPRLQFTADPMVEQLAVAARHAAELGYLPHSDVSGLVDRSVLDAVAGASGSRRAPVTTP